MFLGLEVLLLPLGSREMILQHDFKDRKVSTYSLCDHQLMGPVSMFPMSLGSYLFPLSPFVFLFQESILFSLGFFVTLLHIFQRKQIHLQHIDTIKTFQVRASQLFTIIQKLFLQTEAGTQAGEKGLRAYHQISVLGCNCSKRNYDLMAQTLLILIVGPHKDQV